MPVHGNQRFYIDDRKNLPALIALFDFDQEDEDLEDESSEEEADNSDPDDDDSEETN